MRAAKRASGEEQHPKAIKWHMESRGGLWYFWDEEAERMKPRTISVRLSQKGRGCSISPQPEEEGYRRWGKYLPAARNAPETFKEVYEGWLPTHQAVNPLWTATEQPISTFAPVHNQHMDDIYVDDLQECLDECDKGKRTKENMKTLCGLVYKYAVPRQYVAKEHIPIST